MAKKSKKKKKPAPKKSSGSGKTVVLKSGQVLTGSQAANYGSSAHNAALRSGRSTEQYFGLSSNPNNDAFVRDMLNDPAKRELFDSLPPDLRNLVLQGSTSLQRAIEDGRVVNPNIEISPAQLREFYQQAETELDPHYAEVFASMRGDIDLSLARMTEDYERTIRQSEDPFKKALEEQDNAEADQGTAFSSARADREQANIRNRTNALDDMFRGSERATQDLLRGFESRAGTDRARQLSLPSLRQYSASRGGYAAGSARQLDPGLLGGVSFGSVGAERETALRSRANQLESTYRQNRILDYSSL